jgi:mono/diheme cytochrome c family protein
MAVLLLSMAFLGRVMAAEGGPGGVSVWDGVYTTAQADRGKDLYVRHCSACHTLELAGGEMTPLAGQEFLAHWDGKSIEDLLSLIQETMPQDAVGSLPRPTDVDIISFVLQSNRFPAGTNELKDSPDLKSTFIKARK